MQHARYAKSHHGDDLSQYLRHDAKLPAPNRMGERKGTISSGNMNNVGTTLVVGRRTVPPEKGLDRIVDRSIRGKGEARERGFSKESSESVPGVSRAVVDIPLVLWFHEYGAYSEDMVVDSSATGLRAGDVYEMVAAKKQGKLFVFRVFERNFVLKNAKQKSISLVSSLQKVLGLPQRTAVVVRRVEHVETVELDTVEVYLKDVNFSRDLQWNLSSLLVGTCCHVDQRLSYLGSRVGLVRFLFKDGRKVVSGYIGERTNVTFRSESGKMVFLIQLAREMWHFEESGEIMFHKLVNNLFPMIFKKWRSQASHHAITIVLFTSVDLTDSPWISLGHGERPRKCQDYYRVVVDQVSVFIWDKIMANLRLEFANFKRDILLHREDGKSSIRGEPCPAVKGNLLEAINLALAQASDKDKDTDLRHSVNHLVVITPGTGLFDVDYNLMLETSKKMFNLDCALDIVCLSQPPLHTVPLFRYKDSRGDICHVVPKWCDVSFFAAAKNSMTQWVSRCKIYELQMMGLMENELKDIQLSRIDFKDHVPIVESMDTYDDELFRPVSRRNETKKIDFNDATLSLLEPTSIQDEGSSANAASLSSNLTLNCNRLKMNTLGTLSPSIGAWVTNTSVHGLVTNTSMSNSALSSLYTLNKTGEDKNHNESVRKTEKQTGLRALKTMRLQSELKHTLAQPVKFPPPFRPPGKSAQPDKLSQQRKHIPQAGSQTKSSMALQNSGIRRKNASDPKINKETRASAMELETAEREQNNPYWMVIENPSRPQPRDTSCSRWLDVIPPQIHRKMFRWRSLKAPAALPIGTTLFPTNAEIDTDYIFQIYVVTPNLENRTKPKSTKDLMQEMIRLRLALGFQVCYGDKVKDVEARRKSGGYPEGIVKYCPSGDCMGVRIYLSLNEEIHRLFYDYNGSLNVQLFRKQVESLQTHAINLGSRNTNKPLIRTRYADDFSPSQIDPGKSNPYSLNWNQYDQLLAGYEDALQDSGENFHKMKFVIMPCEITLNAYNINNERLSDEEIRLEGLRKLVTLIQKGSYEGYKGAKSQVFPEINFYTGNLHDFLYEQAEYFDLLGQKPTNSLMIGLRFNKNIRLGQLAAELQAPGGIKLVDRTWHFKMHPHCFLGSDLVTWLVNSFEDLDEREEATEYGQLLMKQGLFSHVEERHGFLDGHYFYEFTKDYVDKAYIKKVEASKGWFRRKALDDRYTKPSKGSSKEGEKDPNEKDLQDKDSKETSSRGRDKKRDVLVKKEDPVREPVKESNREPVTEPIRESSKREDSFKKEASLKLDDVVCSTPLGTRNNSVDSNVPQTMHSLLLNESIELRKTISLHLTQEHSDSSSLSETQKHRKKKRFLISEHVRYNCDPLGKSFRPELIDIHYDSVHNPEHCYHIRLQWLNTSMKFIDETIIGWSRFCERYGLKLIETPWRELCTIPETSPFHSFVDLKLAVNPLTDDEFKDCEILRSNKFYFHLHFLKVADFFLDNRGTSFFAKDTFDICYSWGKSQFKYAQFIHKTGSYIVELRENGEFFLAPNNVHISRLSTMVNLVSETSDSSSLESQQVMLKFRESCKDEAFLRQLFRDSMKYLSEDYDAAYVDGM